MLISTQVVIELRGRGLLPQQARRLMGVAVLMQRGELPADAFDVLTRRDVVLATPLPPALEYFAGARYSALEVKGGDAWPDDDGADAWLSAAAGATAHGRGRAHAAR